MKRDEFIIPIAGLKDKVYQFEYELEKTFFEAAENTVVRDPDIHIHLQFDKTKEPYVLDFSISGDVEAECDRCATDVRVNVNEDYRLFVEFGEAANPGEDNTEVIFIPREAHDIDLTNHIHDYVYLSIPLVKRCSEPEDVIKCDERISGYLAKNDSGTDKNDPRWEALKKLK